MKNTDFIVEVMGKGQINGFQGQNQHLGHINLVHKKQQRKIKLFRTVSNAKMLWHPHCKPKGLLCGH